MLSLAGPNPRVVSLCLALAGAMLVASSATAKCVDGGLMIWPPSGSRVPANVRFVLEEHRGPGDFSSYLATSQPVLVGPRDTIPLLLENDHQGWMLQQVVLIPARPPLPDAEYELRFQGIEDGDRRLVFRDDRLPRWAIGRPSIGRPRWVGSPRVVSSAFDDSFDCDTVSSVTIDVPAQSDSPIQALVTLQPFVSGSVDAGEWPDSMVGPIRVPVENGKLILGHSQCAGGFAFGQFEGYRMTVALVNASGFWSEERVLDFKSPAPIKVLRMKTSEFKRPNRTGKTLFRVNLRIQPGTSERVFMALSARLGRLNLAASSPRMSPRGLQFDVAASSDAKEWLPRLLRPGNLEIWLTTRFDMESSPREGIQLRPHYVREMFTGQATPEMVALRSPLVVTHPGIRSHRMFVEDAAPILDAVSVISIDFDEETARKLSREIGRRQYAVTVDGQVFAVAAEDRLPFDSIQINEFLPVTGPLDVLESVLNSGPVPGIEVRSIRAIR